MIIEITPPDWKQLVEGEQKFQDTAGSFFYVSVCIHFPQHNNSTASSDTYDISMEISQLFTPPARIRKCHAISP